MGTMAVMSALVILTWPRLAVAHPGRTIRSDGWSVPHLGVHFPSDIMAGWSVAGLGDWFIPFYQANFAVLVEPTQNP